MFDSIIWNMYNKEEAFLLWFPAHSMNVRVGNALFPLVILTLNFCVGYKNGWRLQGFQWNFLYPLDFRLISSQVNQNENWLLFT